MAGINRRSFIKTTAGAVAAGTLIGTSKVWAGANERINVAVIGLNGRGKNHIDGFQGLENVEVTTLCDIDEGVLAERAKSYGEKHGKTFKTETDLRKILDDPDIHAVSIATPNHWHSLAAIWACQAGKDVYVEKPGSHNIYEGRKMIEAAHKYNRVVQHGVQMRSSSGCQEAVQQLRDGVIGDVYLARGLCFKKRDDIGHKPAEPVPPGIHYDLWQGPAQERPFTRNLVHYNWHWHWDFGNGDVGNQGIHQTDMCLWGLGVGLPEEITALGGKFLFDDDKETPEALTCLYRYPKEKKMIQFEVRPWYTNDESGINIGNLFYGSKGYMVIRGDTYETFLGGGKEKGPTNGGGGNHFGNFIDVVRSRDLSKQNGPVETAHTASALAHLGNIAYRLNRTLKFDPEKECFIGDKEADKMLTRDYRKPFVVPDVV